MITTNVNRVFSQGSYFKPPAAAPVAEEKIPMTKLAPAHSNYNNEYMEEITQLSNEMSGGGGLESLNRNNYVRPSVIEKERKEREKQEEKEKKARGRPKKETYNVPEVEKKPHAPTLTQAASNNHDDKDDLGFEDLMGRELRQKYLKIMRYKDCFKENVQIQKLRVKKSATSDDLDLILLEIENILDMSQSIDTFIITSILEILPMIEQQTYGTDFDICGLSQNLKKDKNFMNQCKELWLKYGNFSAIPIEYRFAYTLFMVTYATVSANNAKRANYSIAQKPVDSSILSGL